MTPIAKMENKLETMSQETWGSHAYTIITTSLQNSNTKFFHLFRHLLIKWSSLCLFVAGKRLTLIFFFQNQEQTFTWLIFKCKLTKIVIVMSLKYIPVTQSILCLILLMCVATMHHAKFERSCFHGVWEKAHVSFFFKWENMSLISFRHMWKSKIVVYIYS